MSSSQSAPGKTKDAAPMACFAELSPERVLLVEAMVCRKWDAHNSFGKYLSTEFILSDQQGRAIRCTARSNISHRFAAKLVEGDVCSFKKYLVIPNKDRYRVRKTDDYIIALEGYTVVKKIDCPVGSFARYPFDLVPLEDVELNDSIYLIDVIGCVVDAGKTRTTTGGSELLDFEILNERGTRARVTLWSPLCNELLKRKRGAPDPYVVILPAMNVKEFRGELFLSSTSATVLFDAPDIPQISTLATLLKDSVVGGSSVKPLEPSVVDGSVFQLLRTSPELDGTKKKPVTFHCKGRIQEIRTKDGWFYFSCGLGGCKKRVSRCGTKFVCQACNKVSEFPRTSYRLHLTVADSTGTVVVTMFDDVASKLLGKSAAQLLLEVEDEDDENVIPSAIVGLTDTTHTFEIKSNSYYDQGSYESFTVNRVIGLPPDKVLPQKRSHSDMEYTTSSNADDRVEHEHGIEKDESGTAEDGLEKEE